jgi:hypothetical protein
MIVTGGSQGISAAAVAWLAGQRGYAPAPPTASPG